MPISVPNACIAVYVLQKTRQTTAALLVSEKGCARCSGSWGSYMNPTLSSVIYLPSKRVEQGWVTDWWSNNKCPSEESDRHLSLPSKAEICNGEKDHKKKLLYIYHSWRKVKCKSTPAKQLLPWPGVLEMAHINRLLNNKNLGLFFCKTWVSSGLQRRAPTHPASKCIQNTMAIWKSSYLLSLKPPSSWCLLFTTSLRRAHLLLVSTDPHTHRAKKKTGGIRDSAVLTTGPLPGSNRSSLQIY